MYESTDKAHESFSESELGIVSDVERWQSYCFNGYNDIYGNLVAGMSVGISLGCEIKFDYPSFVCNKNTKVYNNTLVDNLIQF